MTVTEYRDHPLNQRLGLLTSMWTEKLKLAREDRKEFDLVADQCRMFYSNSQKFWSDSRTKAMYIKDSGITPSFNLTICKAFELVALFGPLLYWRNPQRRVAPRKPIPVIPELFDPPPEMQNPMPQPGVDPQQQQQMVQQQIQQFQQQMAQQIGQQQGQKHSVDTVRAEILEQVLNWLPGQQTGGGLAAHSRRAITDALITGRGCLWTSGYQMPDSDMLLCGSFYAPPDDLLIDPDATKPDLSDAYWIARRIVEPVWVVERKYNLPKGSVKANINSADGLSEVEPAEKKHKRRNGGTQDLCEYYVIYSKSGIGRKFRAQSRDGEIGSEKLLRKIDEAVGDYVHLVIADGTPFPLNLPGETLAKASSEDIQQAMKWPIEFWRDGAWPVQVIDFYENNESCWPIAPLKPALGELIFINIILSAMAERVWNSCEDIVAIAMDKWDEVKGQLQQKVGTRRYIKLDAVTQNVTQAIQFLQNPPANFDIWQMIDRMIHLFEQRTGLSDMLQGMVTTQDRSAEATATRREQMNLRPDDLSAKVESWMTRVAGAERIALRSYVTGQSLQRLLGQYGAWLYDKLITSEDMENVLRDIDVTIEAGSARKPNKQREVTNLEQVTPLLMPVLQNYMQVTTDTRPVMWLIGRIADAMELDLAGLQLGPMQPPPPPPQVAQQQQAEQQANERAQQMELQAKAADVQAKQAVASQKMQQVQMQHALKMREMEADAQKSQLEALLHREESQNRIQQTRLESSVKQQELMQRLVLMAAEAQAERDRMMNPAPPMQEAI